MFYQRLKFARLHFVTFKWLPRQSRPRYKIVLRLVAAFMYIGCARNCHGIKSIMLQFHFFFYSVHIHASFVAQVENCTNIDKIFQNKEPHSSTHRKNCPPFRFPPTISLLSSTSYCLCNGSSYTLLCALFVLFRLSGGWLRHCSFCYPSPLAPIALLYAQVCS